MPIVEATAVSASTGGLGSKFANRDAGRIIQSAMTKAVADAYAQGVISPVEIKKRMQEAREQAVASLLGNPKR